jgi:hypothetical protein
MSNCVKYYVKKQLFLPSPFFLGIKIYVFYRYQMTGSDAEGDYTLSIFPLQLEDDAIFQCQV